ncbi:helix-hairpin-helix domain-containing protein [bacterium]|nr:helix-hairpin-helix domain-containing protein [bacterium]
MKKIILIAVFVLSFSLIFPFDYNLSKSVQTEDDIADFYENGEISEEEYIELWDLFSNPIDINAAKPNDLQRLPGVTPDLVGQIVRHRPYKKEKDIIRALGRDTYSNIQAFIKFEIPKVRKKTGKKMLIKSLVKFKYVDEISSYHKRNETPYLQLSGQFKLNKTIKLGVVQVRKWATNGYEIYNGPTQYDDNGKIIGETGDVIIDGKHTIFPTPKAYLDINTKHFQLIMGNFGAGFGLGVIFNESGRRLLNGFKGDTSISSTYDYKRLFGGGIRFSFNPINIFVFASQIKDKLTVYSGLLEAANADEVISQEDYNLLSSTMRSIPDFTTKTLIGGHVDIGNENHLVGFTVYHTKEDFETENYRPYTYTEKMFNTFVWGTNFQFRVNKNLLLQGEFGKLKGSDHGLVLRSFLRDKTLDLEFIYRDFTRNFENPYSYTYATWDTPAQFSAQDENGIKFTGKLKLPNRTKIIFKGDIWKYYSKQQTNFDTTLGIKRDITPLFDMSLSLRYKDKDVSRDINQSYITDYSDTDRTTYTYITFNFNPKDNLKFSTTYRYKTYMEHSQPQIKPSSSLSGRISYKGRLANMILSYKFNDDNLYRKYDSSSGYEYRQLQFYLYKYIFNRHIKINFGYKKRWYFEDNTPTNPEALPERTYRLYIDWRF